MKNKFNISKYVFIIILLLNFNTEISKAENSIYNLTAIQIKYINNKNTIIAEGEALAKDQYGREIFSNSIIYYKSLNKLETKGSSKYKDTKNNVIYADQFFYDIKLKKIIAKENVTYINSNGDQFDFSRFDYDENTEIGIGKNAIINFLDKSSMDGQLVIINNKTGITKIKKETKEKNDKKFFQKIRNFFKNYNNQNRYTTCENKNKEAKTKIIDRCPDWSLTTAETIHDKVNKMVYHKNATINLANIPVLYTPYFSHPDPTVKRKSGFLTPIIKNFSDLGRSYKTPYFFVIDNNSDLTFTPVFFEEENQLILTEYKKQYQNSFFALDSSYTKGYKKLVKKNNSNETLNRTSGSRNHLFLNFQGSYNSLLFDNNEVEINLQRVSQKNYLKVYQINTDLVLQDVNNLKNNIIINSYEKKQKLNISGSIYEKLDEENPNTKYSYEIPQINYQNYFNIFDQHANIKSNIKAKNYNGDSKEISQLNEIQGSSKSFIQKKIGISNKVKASLLNTNEYKDKVLGNTEDTQSQFFNTIGLETKFPLMKENESLSQMLTPTTLIKYTSGSMEDIKNNQQILQTKDIISIDRIASAEKIDTGLSLGYGLDYQMDKKNSNKEIFLKNDFFLGQVINHKKNSNKPISSSLNEKKSNFVGKYEFKLDNDKINENQKESIDTFNFSYNFNIADNLDKILKNQIDITKINNKNNLQISYYETHDIDNSQYIEGRFLRKFSENYNFLIGARKNLETSRSDNNFLEMNYESDCLKYGFNLTKKFYNNDDIKTSNNLTFFVMLKPFGQPLAPDLTSLINDN